jgi:hypothetical protein
MPELANDLRNVVKRYGAIAALDGLAAQFPAGTVLTALACSSSTG